MPSPGTAHPRDAGGERVRRPTERSAVEDLNRRRRWCTGAEFWSISADESSQAATNSQMSSCWWCTDHLFSSGRPPAAATEELSTPAMCRRLHRPMVSSAPSQGRANTSSLLVPVSCSPYFLKTQYRPATKNPSGHGSGCAADRECNESHPTPSAAEERTQPMEHVGLKMPQEISGDEPSAAGEHVAPDRLREGFGGLSGPGRRLAPRLARNDLSYRCPLAAARPSFVRT